MPVWKIKDDLAPDAHLQYALGGMLHPTTQLWQLWVTFDGENINWVAAYQQEDKMSEIREKARLAIAIGEKWSRQKALAFLNTLYEEREAEPQPVPFYIEAAIRLNYIW